VGYALRQCAGAGAAEDQIRAGVVASLVAERFEVRQASELRLALPSCGSALRRRDGDRPPPPRSASCELGRELVYAAARDRAGARRDPDPNALEPTLGAWLVQRFQLAHPWEGDRLGSLKNPRCCQSLDTEHRRSVAFEQSSFSLDEAIDCRVSGVRCCESIGPQERTDENCVGSEVGDRPEVVREDEVRFVDRSAVDEPLFPREEVLVTVVVRAEPPFDARADPTEVGL